MASTDFSWKGVEEAWGTVVGDTSALRAVLYNLNAPNFLTALFPAYFIEIAMLIAVGWSSKGTLE